MDRVRQLEVFVQVVERASFAQAAERLELTPPVVTRTVQALEARLGTQLLQRTTRAVQPTAAGQRFYEDSRRLLAELEEAEEAARGWESEPRGELTVTAPVLFGKLHVLPVVLELLEQHPELRARTLFVDRVVNLLEEGMDVAVRIGELPDSSLVAVKLGEVRRVLVAAPEYLKRRGYPDHPRDLARHDTISVGSPRWPGVTVRPRLVVSGNEAAIEAALRGMGITRVLSYQVEGLRLVRLLPEFEPEPWPIHALHFAGRRPARVAAFIARLKARL